MQTEVGAPFSYCICNFSKAMNSNFKNEDPQKVLFILSLNSLSYPLVLKTIYEIKCQVVCYIKHFMIR